jgi:flagellar hook-associated protein 1
MSDLFSTGLSGLSIARTALATTANNTANVYTEGYSRQRVVVATTPALATAGGFIGTGARITTVERSYDRFLNAQLTQSDSNSQALDTYSTQMGRIDDLLADRTSGLGTLVQDFFSSAQGVADTPADPAARQQLLSSAQSLAGKFRSVDSYLSDLGASIDQQLAGSVQQVNSIATQVANLNKQISQLSGIAGGQPPNDLLDTRDKLVSDLSKLVGVTVVQQDGGQYNLFVGNGHSLVLGDRASTMTTVPSAADPTRAAIALATTSGGAAELPDSAVTGGSIGGLLAFRSQSLAPAQNAVGRMATALASAFNAQHAKGFDLSGAAGSNNFFSATGPQVFANAANADKGTVSLSAAVTDATALTTSDYTIQVGGTAGALTYTVTRAPDGQPVTATSAGASAGSFTGFPVTFDGVTVSTLGGTPAPGDSFLVQPTRLAARNLAVTISDPSRIAAAGSTGAAGGVSDGANMLALAGLQRQPVLDGTATLNGAYARLVSDVGNKASEVQVASATQASLAGQVRASQQAVSGVNQDEETANLLMFQQMYQANAKVIQTASTVFDAILGIH